MRRWVAEFISASFVELKGLETVGQFRLLDFSLTKVKKTNIMKKNQIVKEALNLSVFPQIPSDAVHTRQFISAMQAGRQFFLSVLRQGDTMSSNIADLIEEYILRQLAAQQDGKVELRRTEIADKISCAPSQISYVLNTRFTQEKGFTVESRRGLGGFIRIVQVPLQNLVYQDMLKKLTEESEPELVQSMVRYLVQHGMISTREAALVMQSVTTAYEKLEPKERLKFIRSLLLTLEKFS